MNWIEKRAQLLTAIAFGALLAVVMMLANQGAFRADAQDVVPTATPTPIHTHANPYHSEYPPLDDRCHLVADDAEALRYAMQEGWLPRPHLAWERRPKAYQGDISAGVDMSVAYVDHEGYIRTHTEKVKNAADYERVRAMHTGVLSRAHRVFVMGDGTALDLHDEFGRVRPHMPSQGAHVKYVVLAAGDVTPNGYYRCFYKYGAGLPTPTPEPTSGGG